MRLATASRRAPSAKRCFLLQSALLQLAVMLVGPIVEAQTATTTTLAVSPSSPVAAKTVVTLTATVVAGATPVHPGLVTFCDTSLTTLTPPNEPCASLAVVGTAQLTSAGTAVLKLRPGIGSHIYEAVFAGTTTYTTSSSTAQDLTVSPPYPTTTNITSSGSAGNYTLTATVVGTGSFTSGPTGVVSFLDTTNSNSVLGMGTLGAATLAQTFSNPPGSPVAVGTTPDFVAVGDFNGDGIPDLAVTNSGSNTVSILLGNGSGGFTNAPGSPIAVGVNPTSVAVGDFDGNGTTDLAVTNSGSNTVSILLGNGSGGFSNATGSPFSGGFTNPTTVAVGDFNGDGNADLAVTNFGSTTLSIFLGNGSGGFSQASGSPVAVGGSPYFVAVGDFNGNGIKDLVVTEPSSNTISTFLGNGSGGFSPGPGSPYAVGSQPMSVAVTDLNGNGFSDIAVTNAGSNSVSIFLSNGNSGHFTESSGSPFAVGANPRFVAVGDFNGNGIPDLAVTNTGSNTVSILLGKGNGGFTNASGSPFAVGTGPDGVAVGDFNGDGIPDLATSNSGANNVSILLNQVTQTATATKTAVSVPGSGTHNVDASYPGDTNFSSSISPTIPLTGTPIPTTLALTAAPTSSSYGQQVVLTATLSSTPPYPVGSLTPTGTVTFFSNGTQIGTGTVTSGVATLNITSLPLGTLSLTAVYAGDANFVTSTSPALPHVVSMVTTTTTLAVSPSTSPVAAKTVVTLTATVKAGATPVHPGLVTFCDSSLTTLPTPTDAPCAGLAVVGTAQLTSTGTAVLKYVPGGGSHSYKAVFAGTTTYATSTSTAQPLTVSVPPPPFVTTTSIASSGSAGNYTLTATVVGFSNTALTGNVSFFDTTNSNLLLGTAPLGASTPTLGFVNGPTSPVAVGGAPWSEAVGDFNGDGIQDLAVANESNNTVAILLGDGHGNFTPAPGSPVAVGSKPYGVAVGDFNGDGIQDLAVTNYSGNNVTILLGNGTGGFTPAPGSPVAVGVTPISVAVGDFNGDGIQDLAVSNNNAHSVSILLGDGTGKFVNAPGSPVAVGGTNAEFVTIGDFNGDGIQDLAVANYNSTMAILLGNGSGGFTPAPGSPVTIGSGAAWVAVGDFNGDGIQDLATANSTANNVSVLLGNGSGGFTQAPGSPIAVGAGVHGVVVADFDGDGIADLATANGNANNVSVLRGNGNGTFTAFAGSPVALGTSPNNLAVGSFDGLSNAELTTANTAANNVSILLYTITETATATLTGVSVPGSGTHNVDASYPGDTNYSSDTSPTIPLTGTPIPTTLALTAAPTSSTYGQQVVLTATLSSTPPYPVGSLTPTGTVTFFSNGTQIGTGTVTSGVATLNITSLPAGTLSLTAVYGGDANFVTSTSPALPHVVSKATPVITWANPAAITYGTALSATQLNATASVPGTFVYNPASGAVLSAGSQTLNVTFTPTDTTDYTTATASVTLVVNKAVLTVTAANASRVYGAANPTFTDTITGFVNGDSATVVTGAASLTTTATTASPAGTYAITAALGTLAAANYSFTFVNGTLTVTKATLIVTANDASRAYGAANPAFTDTITGFVNGDTATVVTGAASLTTTATTASPVGAYPITAALGTLAAANYTFTFVNGTLTVTKAVLTVTANNASRAYGAANPAFTDTITGFVNGDTATVVTGAASLTTTATTASPAGTYAITAALGTLAAANYTFTFVNGTLTVTQAVLTVTANNLSRVYGAADPTFTDTITGFVNGDTQASAVTGAASLTTTATTTSPAGTYAITAALGTLAAANYTFTFVNGTLTVTQAVLTVTANNLSRAYGAANPAFTDTITGFVNGDTQASAVTGAASLTTTATAASPAGTYAITAALGTLAAANYTFTFVNGTLTVTQAVLTVTANNLSRTYGVANPTFTDMITGFVNGDTATVVTGAASLTTTATAASPAGTYPITAALGTLAAANYTFTFVNGTLTVTQAVLTVTANNASRAYGVANPAFTDTITGFVNGDTATVVTGAASLTTTATTASPVGAYPITAALGTLAAANYTFTFVNGTLVVTQAVLTVTANNLSRAYGVANPAFTDTITGFVNGDTQGSVVTGTASLTTTATAASSPGTYPITAALGTLAAANYTFAFVNGTLTVTQAVGVSTTLTVAPTTVMYGNPAVLTAVVAPAGATGTVSFYDGATLLGTASLNGSATAVLSVSTLNVGTHTITAKYNGDVNFPASTSNAVTLTDAAHSSGRRSCVDGDSQRCVADDDAGEPGVQLYGCGRAGQWRYLCHRGDGHADLLDDGGNDGWHLCDYGNGPDERELCDCVCSRDPDCGSVRIDDDAYNLSGLAAVWRSSDADGDGPIRRDRYGEFL